MGGSIANYYYHIWTTQLHFSCQLLHGLFVAATCRQCVPTLSQSGKEWRQEARRNSDEDNAVETLASRHGSDVTSPVESELIRLRPQASIRIVTSLGDRSPMNSRLRVEVVDLQHFMPLNKWRMQKMAARKQVYGHDCTHSNTYPVTDLEFIRYTPMCCCVCHTNSSQSSCTQHTLPANA